MAKRHFRIAVDGGGRERFFIDGGECNIDHFVAQYVKDHSSLPTIPSWELAKEKAAQAKLEAEAKELVEAVKTAESAQEAAEETINVGDDITVTEAE